MFLLALGALINKYNSNKENGDISEDDYDKEALYCILYNLLFMLEKEHNWFFIANISIASNLCNNFFCFVDCSCCN